MVVNKLIALTKRCNVKNTQKMNKKFHNLLSIANRTRNDQTNNPILWNLQHKILTTLTKDDIRLIDKLKKRFFLN